MLPHDKSLMATYEIVLFFFNCLWLIFFCRRNIVQGEAIHKNMTFNKNSMMKKKLDENMRSIQKEGHKTRQMKRIALDAQVKHSHTYKHISIH